MPTIQIGSGLEQPVLVSPLDPLGLPLRHKVTVDHRMYFEVDSS